MHAALPSTPFWYLGVLGTHPDHAGRRWDHAVMRAGLRRAAADGLPAILETSNGCRLRRCRRSGCEPAKDYRWLVVGSGGMTLAVKRTLSMRPEVDRMLAAHVQRTPGATLSSTVNAALVEYLENPALEAYRQWDAEADPDERGALEAFAVHDDKSWASG